MTRAAVLVVDGGNSKTDLALVGADGSLLALVRGPLSSPHHLGVDGCIDVLAKLLAEAVHDAQVDDHGDKVADVATLLIAGFFFASGLFRGITAIVDRYPHWGWDLGYAVIAIGLGVIVVGDYPFSAFWILGTLVAVEIIARGAALIAASTMLREIAHHA